MRCRCRDAKGQIVELSLHLGSHFSSDEGIYTVTAGVLKDLSSTERENQLDQERRYR